MIADYRPRQRLDRNIVPRSVRVGTDFLVRLAGESLELRLRERRSLRAASLDAESARFARPDRRLQVTLRPWRSLLLDRTNRVRTEAGGVADREQMLGVVVLGRPDRPCLGPDRLTETEWFLASP